MISRVWLWPLTGVMLSACLPFQKQALHTLDDLDESTIVVDPGSAIKTDRRQALQHYQEFLAVGPDTVLEREAMRRVADLQLEIDNGTGESNDRAQRKADAENVDANISENENPEAAVLLYQDLLDTYPNQTGNDQLLYQLARAYDDSGRPDKAYETLGTLVTDYPDSPFVAEAYFRQAEMDFLHDDYTLAEPEYQKVLDFGEQTPFYQRARYKLGWSLFKQESYERALAVFFTILDFKLGAGNSTVRPTDLSLPDKEFVEETLRVISLSFSYLGGANAINEYFSQRPDIHYEDLVYTALATLFLEKERYFDAALTYRGFSDRHPRYFLAPAFLIKAIDTYRKGGFQPQVLAAMNSFAQTYDLDRPYWQRHSPSTQAETINSLREIMDALALHYHALAQKTHAPADYEQAIGWYRRYLTDFPAAPRSIELHYLLAEALYETQRYGEAAVAYEQTAYDYPSHPMDKKAAQAAIVAFDHQAESAPEAERTLWHLRALASRLRLADRFPHHAQAATSLARATQDYFTLGEYDPATVTAGRLLAMNPLPASDLRQSAWLVLGHIGFDQRSYVESEKAYHQALTLMSVKDSRRPDIVERLASAIYKQGEDLRSTGDLAGAAAQFLRVAVAAPGSAIVASAEYDAAAALITLKQWSKAIAVLEAFRDRFPDRQQDDISVKLAAAYLEDGQGLKAAHEFEHIGSVQGDPSLRQEALWRSAELYEKAGKPTHAASMYSRYIKDFPNDFPQGMEARQRLAELNLAVGNKRRYLFWLRQIVETDQQAGEAGTARSRTLAAQASLVLAQSSQEQFDKIALKLPLKKSLKSKKALMEKALATYRQAADYGIAEVATAATFGMGEIYRAFGRALMESQRPKGLSEDELEEYEILLEEQAFPFEEDAIAIHEDNSRHGSDGVYDRWVKASYEVLADMLPVRYAKQERSEAFIDVIE